jgi:hypothetical protein
LFVLEVGANGLKEADVATLGRRFATDLLDGGLQAVLAKGLQLTEAQIIARIDEFAGLLEKGKIVQGLR